MKKNFIIILVLIFLLILISGCINILPTLEDDSIALGKGILKIYLTDSSGDYKAGDDENYSAVYITISKIEVHLAGENGEDEGEWIWVAGEESSYELIEELTDNSILLSEVELTPGKYTQIRLFVDGVFVIIEAGSSKVDEKSDSEINKEVIVEPTSVNVEIPSNLQTGLKLIHPFEIIENGTTELIIDFDAEKSIVKTGNGSYKLKPVIKIVTISAEETEEPAEE